jgi:plastocyanin
MTSSWMRRLLAIGLMGSMLVLVPAVANAGKVKIKASCTGGCHWAPSFKKVAKGTKIVWKNPSGVFHNVKSFKGHWLPKRNLAPGAKIHKRLWKHGVYHFRCTLHSTLINGVCSGMCGKIKVKRR